MNHLFKTFALFAMLGLMSSALPAAADGKERELADRVFEKYKQREEKQRNSEKQRGERSSDKQRRERDSRSKSGSSSRERTSERKRETRERSTRERSSSSRDSRKRTQRAQSSSFVSGDVDENDLVRAARELDQSLQRKREQDRSRRATDRSSRSSRSQSSDRRMSTTRRTQRSTNTDSSQSLSLDQAVAKVRRDSGGRVLSATTSGQGSSRKHRIKVMIDERRVRTYIVDATTGRIY